MTKRDKSGVGGRQYQRKNTFVPMECTNKYIAGLDACQVNVSHDQPRLENSFRYVVKVILCDITKMIDTVGKVRNSPADRGDQRAKQFLCSVPPMYLGNGPLLLHLVPPISPSFGVIFTSVTDVTI